MAVAVDVEIRVLRPADAPRVADLLAVAFAEEFEGAGAEVQGLHRQLRAGAGHSASRYGRSLPSSGWSSPSSWRSTVGR